MAKVLVCDFSVINKAVAFHSHWFIRKKRLAGNPIVPDGK